MVLNPACMGPKASLASPKGRHSFKTVAVSHLADAVPLKLCIRRSINYITISIIMLTTIQLCTTLWQKKKFIVHTSHTPIIDTVHGQSSPVDNHRSTRQCIRTNKTKNDVIKNILLAVVTSPKTARKTRPSSAQRSGTCSQFQQKYIGTKLFAWHRMCEVESVSATAATSVSIPRSVWASRPSAYTHTWTMFNNNKHICESP